MVGVSAQRSVTAAEVVMREVQGDSRTKIFQVFC